MKRFLLLLALAGAGSFATTELRGVEPERSEPTTEQLSAEEPAAAQTVAAETFATETPTAKKVYVFPIREDIMPATVRLTAKCLEQAAAMEADYIIVNMNTYGGLLDAADSIRTMLQHVQIPVFTFVNNQAASAGALIALATDSIYMRPGASIGAASVVDGNGEVMPDKYQSFMRSMMRSTAEAHGKVPVVEKGDTTWVWRRNPRIAEAMVDPSIVVGGISEEGKVLTFTPDEAIEWGYCEGRASSVEEVLSAAGIDNYEVTEYQTTFLDALIGFLTNPVAQGIFIMLIIGGIYFELQTPGVGFPLAVAIIGAMLYFAPLYVEGLLANWELITFIAGIILIILEIFVTPGFGILGITGIIAVITGLAFALIETGVLKYIPTGELPAGVIIRPFMIVIISTATAFILSVLLGNRFLRGRSVLRNKLVLAADMTAGEGYVSHETHHNLVGCTAVTSTQLRPAGKIFIDGKYCEAASDNGIFIEKGVTVTITRTEGGVVYCRES